MANSNNWGEIYKSTWWGDEDWSANSLKIDSAPPGFAGQNLLLGSEELDQSDVGEWVQLNINAVDANVAGVANPLSSDETVEKVDFQATPTSRIIQDVTLVAGTQYTFSVWAKSAGASNEQFRLRYWDRTAASGGGDLFTALTTDWSPTSGRYSFTFTAASSGVHAMHIQNSGSVQRRIYFWGAMLNEGATAGDYIKTEFTPQPSNPPTAPMEFGDNFVGVTAYYSLRRFTTGEDNNAIRVRRSSDDTEQDIGFDANGDLDTTALTTFVNEDVNQYTSDFSSTEDLAEINGTGAAAQSIGGVDDAYKFTLSGGSALHQSQKATNANGGDFSEEVGTLTFDYYLPSGQTMDEVFVGFTSGTAQGQTTKDAWTSVSMSITAFGGGTLFFRGKSGGGQTFSADGDVFYLKNIVVTQTTADGAVTTFYDQSGNGNNATNATASEQPLVVSGGTLVEENGKAAINADGTNVLQTATGAIGSVSALSVFSVLKYNVTGANNDMAYGITSSAYGGADDNFFFRQLSGNFEGKLNDATQASSINLSTADTSQYLFSHLFVGGSKHELVKNGSSTSDTTNIPSALNLSQELEIFSVLGTILASDMKLQELIIFNSDQSSNRTGMETNINDHFSIYP